MRFTFRVTCILAFIILFSVGLNTLLSAYSFQKSYKEYLASRYAVIGQNVKRSIDYGLGVGLELESNGNLQTVIDRVKQHAPELVSIAIVDDQGTAIYHTDQSLIGQPVLRDWLYGLPFRKDAVWPHDEGDGMAFSLYNNFGVYVGALDITYDRQQMETLFAATFSRFEVAGIVVTAVSLFLAFIAISLIGRRMQQSLLWYESTLQQLIDKRRLLSGNVPEEMLYGEEFGQYASESATVLAELEARYDAATKETAPIEPPK